jgi:NADPH:quinone reductase and related Zn-dependent oxidoreductases
MLTVKYSRIIVSKFGGPENLHLIEEEIPEPRANEVRVKILTAGVSMADILIRGVFIRNHCLSDRLYALVGISLE